MAEHQHDIQHNPPKSSRKVDKSEKDQPSVTNPTLRLQALIGNQAVQRLMAQGRMTLPSGAVVQAKMTVTSADNAYESEADSVAAQVVSRMASEEVAQTKRADVVQRQDEEELQTKRAVDVVQRQDEEELQTKRVDVVQRQDEEELQTKRAVDVVQRQDEEELQTKRIDVVQRQDEEELQTKRDPAFVQREEDEEMQAKRAPVSLADSFDVGSDIEQQINSARGQGQAMPADLQRSMGDAFGADFSSVRLHTDPESDKLNAQVGARAFTTGSDVFFREGEFQPDTPDGKKLLAHELTHTLQQNAVRRKEQSDD